MTDSRSGFSRKIAFALASLVMGAPLAFARPGDALSQGMAAFRAGHFSKAVPLLEKAAGKNGRRSARADIALGRIYESPKSYVPQDHPAAGDGSVKRDDKASFVWLMRAAKLGSARAEEMVAVRYHDGTGVAKSRAKAAYWQRKAARAGDARAMGALIYYYTGALHSKRFAKNCKQARSWIRRAVPHLRNSKTGDISLRSAVSWAYYTGSCVARNPKKSESLDLKNAYQGDEHSLFLASMDAQIGHTIAMLKGAGFSMDKTSETKKRKPSPRDIADSIHALLPTRQELRLRHLMALFGDSSSERRVLWSHEQKAESGDTKAIYYVASAALMGLGEHHDLNKAYRDFSMIASRKGSLAANARRQMRALRPFVKHQEQPPKTLVGRIEQRFQADCGCLLASDQKHAFAKIGGVMKKAHAGDADAQMRLALAYLRISTFVTPYKINPKLSGTLRRRAAKLVREAARGGQSQAVRMMAMGAYTSARMYPTPANRKRALMWEKKASALHDALAETELGERYFRGDGVARNEKRALALFKRAAVDDAPNVFDAASPIYRLGVMNLVGLGVAKHLGRADVLLLLAFHANLHHYKSALMPDVVLNRLLDNKVKRAGLSYVHKLLTRGGHRPMSTMDRILWQGMAYSIFGNSAKDASPKAPPSAAAKPEKTALPADASNHPRIKRIGEPAPSVDTSASPHETSTHSHPDIVSTYFQNLVELVTPKMSDPGVPFNSEANEQKLTLQGNVMLATALDDRYILRIHHDMINADQASAVRDAKKRLKWLVKGAKAGNPELQATYGLYLTDGIKVGHAVIAEKSCKRGMRWMEKAVRGPYEVGDAYFDLGTQYLNGECVAVDPEKAIAMLKKAARLGSGLAARILGGYYLGTLVSPTHHFDGHDATQGRYWMIQGAMDYDYSPGALFWLIRHATSTGKD